MGLYLYELFIDPDVQLPIRLGVRSFDDLKSQLVAVVIVVIAVTYLGHVVSWDGERDLLRAGAAVTLVIGALTSYLWVAKVGSKK